MRHTQWENVNRNNLIKIKQFAHLYTAGLKYYPKYTTRFRGSTRPNYNVGEWDTRKCVR